MAKSETPKKKTTTGSPRRPRRQGLSPPRSHLARRLGQEMAALLLLGLAGFSLLALWTYTSVDFPVSRACGRRGGPQQRRQSRVLMAHCLIGLLGLAAYWAPLMLLGLAWQSHHEGLEDLGWLQTLSGLGVLLASAGLLSLVRGSSQHFGGGYLGSLLTAILLPVSIRWGPLWPWPWSCSSVSWGPPACPMWVSWPSWARDCGGGGARGGNRPKSCRRRPPTTPGGQPWGVRLSPRLKARRRSRS